MALSPLGARKGHGRRIPLAVVVFTTAGSVPAMKLRVIVVGAVAVLLLDGCGGGGDDVTVSSAGFQTTTSKPAPKCDDLFAAGATLPAVMPDLCERARGDLLAVVFFTCADKRRLYQVDVSAGQAWAFEDGKVHVGADIAGDPAYRAAYEACDV